MPDAWSEYSDIHINTMPVPAHTGLSDGTVVYSWQVEAIEELAQDDVISLQNLKYPASMGAVSIDVLDSRRFRLSQVGRHDSELLSSGPIAARVIDEQAVRLWLVDDVPHVWYPVFMDQIRDQIRSLAAIDRRRWTWLGLLRAEPMVAVVADYEMSNEDLLPAVFEPSQEAQIEAALTRMEGALRRVPDGGLAGKLLQAVKAASAGTHSDSVNKLAYSREQAFDALYSSDESLGRHRVPLAKAEDRARMQDVLGLNAVKLDGQKEIIARSRQYRSELRAALKS